MTKLNPRENWRYLGESVNCSAYLVEDDIMAMIPHEDVRETEETARDNLAFQARYWQQLGRGGAVVIFMDPILEQDAGARAVYANEAGAVGTRCFALIGESYFAMAAASVYTGLARPSVPIDVFRNFEDALPWLKATLSTEPAG